jgi:hypothetical protein
MKKVVTVSYSELSSARQCGLKHHLQYVERWSKPSAGARSLGTRWHAILAAHYSALQQMQEVTLKPIKGGLWNYHPDDANKYSTRVGTEFASQPDDAAAKTLEWMYNVHLNTYGLQLHWTILGVEQEVTVPLPEIEGSDIQFKLKVVIDLIVQDQFGRTIVVDHKTSQNMMSPEYTAFMDQFGLYDWALTQLGHKIHQNVIQFQKTTKYKTEWPDKPYARHFLMDRTDYELDVIALDAVRTAYQAYTWPHELLGEPPSHPNPEMCQRMCDFREAHLNARRGLTTMRGYLTGTGFAQDLSMVDPQHRPE